MITFRLPYLNDRTNQLLFSERTEPIYWRRFTSTKANHRYLWLLWMQAMVVGPVTVVLLESFRYALLIPLYPLLLDLIRLLFARSSEPPRMPRSLLSTLPLTCCWCCVVLLAGIVFAVESRLWPIVLASIAVGCTLRLCIRLNRHYQQYTLESFLLSVERRTVWRDALEADWINFPPPVQPGRSDLSEEEIREFHRMRKWLLTFRFRLTSIVVGVMGVCGGYLFVTWQQPSIPVWATSALCWSITLVPVVGLLISGACCPRSTWRAVVNWCWSPPDVWPQNRAPWMATSPCGSCWSRRAELLWSHVLVGCCLIPPSALHPMYFAEPSARESFAIPKEEMSRLIVSTWGMFTMLIQLQTDHIHSLHGPWYLFTLIAIVPIFVASTVLFVSGPSLHAAHRLFQGPGALEQQRQELLLPTVAETNAAGGKEPAST